MTWTNPAEMLLRRCLMKTEKIVSVRENQSPGLSSVITSAITTMGISSGLMLMLGTAFELDFDWVSVLAISFVTSIAFAAVFYLNKKKLSMGGFIAAPSILALLLITNLFKVRTGLLGLCYYIRLYAFYWFPGNYDDYAGENTAIFAFLAAYNLIAVCCTSYFLMRRRLIPVGLLTYLPVFVCAVANIIMVPRVVPCLIAATGVILLLFAHAFRNKSRAVAERALLILIIPVIIFSVLFGSIFPGDKYKQNELATNILISMQEKVDKTFGSGSKLSMMLDNAINGFKNPYFEENYDMFSPLYSSSTNLERIGPFNPTSDPVLRVNRKRNLSYNGPLFMGHTMYLKVESFDTYENNTLKSSRVTNNVYKDDYRVFYQQAPCTVEITPIGYSAIDIVPYYNDFYVEDSTEYSNVNPFNNTYQNQTVFAASPLPVQTGNIYSEQYLNTYVYRTCLRVPYGTKGALIESGDLPDWYLDVYHGYTEMSDVEKVRRVTEFVSQLHPYDRDTEYPPEDVDFVAWFVSDAESGICVHYAATTMVLLRMIGVPTRYVRGYVVNNSFNDSESIVTAEQAHAWFEFFIPEYGWVMGDSTPGCGSDARFYNVDALTKAYPEIENPELGNNEEPTEPSESSETEPSGTGAEETEETAPDTTETEETSGTTEAGATPTTAASPTTPEGETVPSVDIEYEGTDPAGADDEYISPAEQKVKEIEQVTLKVLLILLIVVVSLVVFVMILRVAYYIFWYGKFNTDKNDEKAIAYYHYYCFMGRTLRFTIPRKAVEIAEKAAFAADSLSDEEIKMLHTLCREHMVECSKSYTRLKKLLFRLLLINI